MYNEVENAPGPFCGNCCIRGIRGSGCRLRSTRRVDKAGGVVFRCTLDGSEADRWLEVPAWMFERAACLDVPPLATAP